MLSGSKALRMALLASAAVAAPGYGAQAQLTVTLGGYTTFRAATYDSDTPGATSREFQNETEIRIRADGKADNGLLYGVRIDLENDEDGGGISTDKASVYVGGSWGRIELGDHEGAANELFIYAPVVGNGQIDEAWYDFAGPGLPTDDLLSPADTSDATKISYVTPRFWGLQAGVSYVPQSDDEAQSVVGFKAFDPDVGENAYQDLVEAGINYKREFAGVSLILAGAYVHGDAKVGSTVRDFNAWGVGTQIGWQGFTVGGAYNDNGDSQIETAERSVKSWNVGIAYQSDEWGVATQYQKVDLPGRNINIYAVGAEYEIAEGLTFGPEVIFFDDDDRQVGDGYVALATLNLEF
jgi:outer membrane protein OmpU